MILILKSKSCPSLNTTVMVLTHPFARRLLQGRMIVEITRSQAPNKLLWAVPHPCNPPNNCCAPVLEMCPLPAPLRLLLEAPDLQPLRGLGWRPYMPRLPRHRPHGDLPLQLSEHPTDLAPWDMWGLWVAPLQIAQSILVDPPAVCRSAPTADLLWFFPFLTFIPAVDPLLLASPGGTISCSPPGRLPSSAIQQQS